MTIPVESSEVEAYTPESLINLPNPPSFRLRAPDERTERRFRRMMTEEGVTAHTVSEFIAEQDAAISILFDEESARPLLEKFRSVRALLDQGSELSDEDAKWFSELESRLWDNHKPLRVIRADNEDFEIVLRSFTVATIVKGWKDFDLPFALDAGFIPVLTVPKIAKQLSQIETQAANDKIDGIGAPGTAFLELISRCLVQSRLTETEEKNLPSPSPTSANPEPSMMADKLDGEFTAESDEALTNSTSTKPAQPTTSDQTDGLPETLAI